VHKEDEDVSAYQSKPKSTYCFYRVFNTIHVHALNDCSRFFTACIQCFGMFAALTGII